MNKIKKEIKKLYTEPDKNQTSIKGLNRTLTMRSKYTVNAAYCPLIDKIGNE